MVRGFAGLVTTVSIAGALLFAPFQHIHEPGRADRHVAEHHSKGLALHIHIPGSSNGDASWQLADESARLLKWFRAKEARSLSFVARPTSAVTIVVPGPARELRAHETDAVVGESPPLVRPSPRGPPA